MPTNLGSITKYFLKAAENSVPMTLTSSISGGAATVPVTGLTNYNDGEFVALIIEPTSAANKAVFTGQKSGANIVNVTWTEGATTAAHTAGVTIIDDWTATHFDLMSTGLQVQHNQNGTHKAITNTGGLTTDTLAVTGTSSLTGATTVSGLLTASGGISASSFALNMKSAANGSTISIANNAGGQNLATNGLSVSFTVAAACNAFVTVSIGLQASSDIEFHPQLYLDGSPYFDFNPNAAMMTANGRATVRGFTIVVPLTLGAHTLSAGIFTMNGGAASINQNAATIAALVLGQVTA